jgi:probable F420-dependent oxidoreductase
MFATDRAMGPAELAQAVEERGFHSLFFPEHTHIPTSRETPAPTGEDELDDRYRRSLDPFVALTAAATVTERIRVGTGICLVAQRDAIGTAKAVATLDLLSGGRFVFGIGFGWNVEEMRSHGIEFKQRRAVVREKVLAMERLWADEVAAFDGEYVDLEPSWAWPKPVQQPRPPVLIGGAAGRKMFAHVAEYADGWIPIGGAGVREALPDLARAAEEAGRDPRTISVVPFGTLPNESKLDYYEGLDCDEVVFYVPPLGVDKVLPILDEYATLVSARK